MLSGVLKRHHDTHPDIKYNLVRRTKYVSILKGHPAIDKIGFPPKSAKIIGSDYWAHPLFNEHIHACNVLAMIFNLAPDPEKKMYLPEEAPIDPILDKSIPWQHFNILIAPSSDSPRKQWPLIFWEQLIRSFDADRYLFILAGNEKTPYIKGAYSLINVTSPREICTIAKKCDLVVTLDNYLLHVAQLVQVPGIVLWGPTRVENYGYEKDTNIVANPRCPEINHCLAPKLDTYSKACDLPPGQFCMQRIKVETIRQAIEKRLS